jgi:hypothetical protein
MEDPEIQVWRDNDGQICAYGYASGGEHWMHVTGAGSFRFSDAADDVEAIPQPGVPLDIVWDAFYRSVLPMALQTRGLEILHASAVLMPCGVLTLCAISESGKSTIAYALSQRGYPLWADDAVAFESKHEQVSAVSLPFKIRLRPASALFFGWEPDAAYTPLHAGNNEQTHLESVPLAALCVLLPDSGGTSGAAVETIRLSPVAAFTALLPHAYCFSLQDVQRKRRMMQHYLDLAKRVPTFEVHFQRGLEHLSAILDSIEHAIK